MPFSICKKKLFEGPHMCQAAVLPPVPDDCHVWLRAVRARWPIFSAALCGKSRRHWLPSRTAQGCLPPQKHDSPAHYTFIQHVCLQMSHCYMSPSSGFHCFSRPQAHAATSTPDVCSVRASHKLRQAVTGQTSGSALGALRQLPLGDLEPGHYS